jgi:hypothetical protein
MLPVEIKTHLCRLPTDRSFQERTYAKNQPQYIPLPCLIDENGTFVTMWQPDANDLELLKNGAPVTITLLHTPYANPHIALSPMKVEVGGTDLR